MILDTSVLIEAERNRFPIASFVRSVGTEAISVAAITVSELLHGYHRASDPAVRARRAAFADLLLDAVTVLPFGLAEARRHAEIWSVLSRRGQAIGGHDLLIAATALARGETLATLNMKEFRRIPGIRLAPL